MNADDDELNCAYLRELALVSLAGAQLFSSDVTFLASSLEGAGDTRRESGWVLVAAGIVGGLTFACLAWLG